MLASLMPAGKVDTYFTLMRRKYIPPLYDTFQEIEIISRFCFPANNASDTLKHNESNIYLKKVH